MNGRTDKPPRLADAWLKLEAARGCYSSAKHCGNDVSRKVWLQDAARLAREAADIMESLA